jgi:hypothetical protein
VSGNRGDSLISLPIKLEASEVKSRIGSISILNATNGLSGAGAVWDISSSVTGDRIPPRSNSNPFCLLFHLEISPESLSRPGVTDLLALKIRVVASGGRASQQ